MASRVDSGTARLRGRVQPPHVPVRRRPLPRRTLPRTRHAFEKTQTYANHVGLSAGETGPSGEQLGNVPQAFAHLSLIMAATTLDRTPDPALDRRVR